MSTIKYDDWNTVELKWPDGTPVEAGDLKPGQTFEVNPLTGEVNKPRRRAHMRKLAFLSALAIVLVGGTGVEPVLGTGSAEARVGRPLTPMSAAGVHRRAHRRYGGFYIGPGGVAVTPDYAPPVYGPRFGPGYGPRWRRW